MVDSARLLVDLSERLREWFPEVLREKNGIPDGVRRELSPLAIEGLRAGTWKPVVVVVSVLKTLLLLSLRIRLGSG